MTGYITLTPTLYLVFSTLTHKPIGHVIKLPGPKWCIRGETETHPTLYHAMKVLEKRLANGKSR